MAETNYILLYHNNPEVITLKDFMEREHIYSVTPEELFSNNKEFIWSQMTDADKQRIFQKRNATIDDLKIDTQLPVPCKLKVNPKHIVADLTISQTNLQIDNNDFYAFESEEISKVLNDVVIEAEKFAEKSEPNIGVFGWFKSLNHFSEIDGWVNTLRNIDMEEFQDITFDVISLSTRIGEEGGSFSIRFPVILYNTDVSSMFHWEKDGEKDVFKEKDILRREKINPNTNNSIGPEKQMLSKTSISSSEHNFYSTLISSNDLLFITFNNHYLNQKASERESEQYKVNGEVKKDFTFFRDLSDGVFDMIGLVDSVQTVVENNNAYVEVTGRDLMKLLLDDGSFFFLPSTCSNPDNIFANELGNSSGDINSIDNTNPLNRLRLLSGEIDIFARTCNHNIDFLIKGIISKLANIEVCPSALFEEWGNKRTKFVDLKPKKK